MHVTAAGRFVRLCFVVLFGTMSLMHGPVMAYGGHTDIAVAHESPHGSHTGGHAGHGDHTKPVEPAACNSFACFLAVEPAMISARPLHAILFGILSQVPTQRLRPVSARPDLPPPRFQS